MRSVSRAPEVSAKRRRSSERVIAPLPQRRSACERLRPECSVEGSIVPLRFGAPLRGDVNRRRLNQRTGRRLRLREQCGRPRRLGPPSGGCGLPSLRAAVGCPARTPPQIRLYPMTATATTINGHNETVELLVIERGLG
jgi:hypothetical protein